MTSKDDDKSETQEKKIGKEYKILKADSKYDLSFKIILIGNSGKKK